MASCGNLCNCMSELARNICLALSDGGGRGGAALVACALRGGGPGGGGGGGGGTGTGGGYGVCPGGGGDRGGRGLYSSAYQLNLCRFGQRAVLCPVREELRPTNLVNRY